MGDSCSDALRRGERVPFVQWLSSGAVGCRECGKLVIVRGVYKGYCPVCVRTRHVGCAAVGEEMRIDLVGRCGVGMTGNVRNSRKLHP